jgi:hypothetical protein
MQCNRKTRNLTEHATCQICGVSDEDGYHAVVECPRARALRKELTENVAAAGGGKIPAQESGPAAAPRLC